MFMIGIQYVRSRGSCQPASHGMSRVHSFTPQHQLVINGGLQHCLKLDKLAAQTKIPE